MYEGRMAELIACAAAEFDAALEVLHAEPGYSGDPYPPESRTPGAAPDIG